MEQAQIPAIVIKPKVTGQGVVTRKDGTISTPEPKKEQQNVCNP